MNTDLSWLSTESSKDTVEVSWNGAAEQIPLAGEMDFIRSLKEIHGALKTWPKKTMEARWEMVSKMCSLLKEDSDEILNLMVAEKGEKLGRRQHDEFLKALGTFKPQDFDREDSTKAVPVGITAVFLDERHPWISWAVWVARSLLHGNAVIARFLPENVRTATYFHHKMLDWGFPKGLLSLFISQDGDFENMICAHPAVSSVLVECPEWSKSTYKRALSGTWKKFAILSETRPVVLLLEESSPEVAQEIVEKSLAPGFGFERLGRLFTLDKFYDGWASDLGKAAEQMPINFLWERRQRQEKWQMQKVELLKEKGVRELGGAALTGFDFSNCSAFQQQILHGPFLSLTRSKYVHEAVKFAQTTPLKSHITLRGPAEKMPAWTQGLSFQNVWCNAWPKWTLKSLFEAEFSDETYLVGARRPGEVFYSLQHINSLCE